MTTKLHTEITFEDDALRLLTEADQLLTRIEHALYGPKAFTDDYEKWRKQYKEMTRFNGKWTWNRPEKKDA